MSRSERKEAERAARLAKYHGVVASNETARLFKGEDIAGDLKFCKIPGAGASLQYTLLSVASRHASEAGYSLHDVELGKALGGKVKKRADLQKMPVAALKAAVAAAGASTAGTKDTLVSRAWKAVLTFGVLAEGDGARGKKEKKRARPAKAGSDDDEEEEDEDEVELPLKKKAKHDDGSEDEGEEEGSDDDSDDDDDDDDSSEDQDSDDSQEEYCPECGRLLQEREGRYGDFIGCSGYPYCDFTRDIDE